MNRIGYLEVVCGPMFAGKSTALSERYCALRDATVDVAVYVPVTDIRSFRRHDRGYYPAWRAYQEPHPELQRADRPTAILIDEAQFLPETALNELQAVLVAGVDVTLYGLDSDRDSRLWPVMGGFMAIADKITKLTGSCFQCGAKSTRTRLRPEAVQPVQAAGQVAIGGPEAYQGVCGRCYYSAARLGGSPCQK